VAALRRGVALAVGVVAVVAVLGYLAWCVGSSVRRIPVLEDALVWLVAVPTPTPAPPVELVRR
jgi:hypothetical protein